MKANALDELFKNQLKDKSGLPSNVTFDKSRVHESIQGRIKQRSTASKVMVYAAVFLLLLGSGYWHYAQTELIQEQRRQLASQTELLNALNNDQQTLIIAQQFKLDSIKHAQEPVAVINTIALASNLKHMPAVVNSYKVTVAKTIAINYEEPIYISDNELPNHNKSSVPELDLPVYYESERLASSSAPKGRSFSKKLSSLINN